MSTNPFTNNSGNDDITGVQGNIGKKYLFIISGVIFLALIIYYLKDKVGIDLAAMDRDFTEGYLMGDPWNGSIVYKDITHSEPSKMIFTIYDTKTKKRETFAEYRIGSDPNYYFYFIGDDKVTLYDLQKYTASFNFTPAGISTSSAVDRPGQTEAPMEAVRAAQDTAAHPLSEDSLRSLEARFKKEKESRPNKNHFVNLAPANWGGGMSDEGSERQQEGLDATALMAMGVADFKSKGLKYSFWVYDVYSRKHVIDNKSGANLVLVEMASDHGNNSTTCFFALIDKQTMKMKLTGFPDNTIKGASYLHDYFMNCRIEDQDHVLCLTRDKVLRVQISTCRIEEVCTW